MADIEYGDQKVIEKYLGMKDGIVLDYSNATFRDMVHGITKVDIGLEKYNDFGTSKANKLRSFLKKEPALIVAALLEETLRHRDEWEAGDKWGRIEPDPQLREQFAGVIAKLRGDIQVPEVAVLKAANDDEDFVALANKLRESVEKGEVRESLDRLHTYLVKYFREMCAKHGIEIIKDEPLNAVYGKYIKSLRAEKMIDSTMAEKIIQSTFQCVEAFNDVRNNKSYAHDNPVLNHEESVLIFNYLTSTLRFLQSIEDKHGNKIAEPEKVNWESF